ncbi:hypothetical protein LDENG_00211460, partial [Lucifuga dentata]
LIYSSINRVFVLFFFKPNFTTQIRGLAYTRVIQIGSLRMKLTGVEILPITTTHGK